MRIYILLFLLLFGSIILNATEHKVGIAINFKKTITTNVIDFNYFINETPENDYCDCMNKTYYSDGDQINLIYNRYLFNNFRIEGRVGLAHNNFNMYSYANYPVKVYEKDPNTGEIINEYSVNTLLRKELSGSVSFITLEPIVKYELFNGFNINAGISLNYLAISDVSVSNNIESPINIKFSSDDIQDKYELLQNGRKLLYYEGDIPNYNSITAGLLFGLSYDLYLSHFTFSPEVMLKYNPMSVSKDDSWTMHSLNYGLAIYYRFE